MLMINKSKQENLHSIRIENTNHAFPQNRAVTFLHCNLGNNSNGYV